ncbi:hypothetical protein ASD04_09735 [Devosia sp. Root436]|uniref:hypothetical protein n=1 Tax=Devosia sp. Root436 TaxID=1736537 RepID=UPI0006F34242|nr:hypothetical protein [Devosia sp. Root436]KQX38917.1 hypothetical protein ASD04_09735 [Devosia sp. Root436]
MRTPLAFAALLLLTAPAFAAPTQAQKDEFYAVCMGIAQNDTLCSCKADAAMTLIDERMMGYVIAGMKGGAVGEPDDVAGARARYLQESNRACGLNY